MVGLGQKQSQGVDFLIGTSKNSSSRSNPGPGTASSQNPLFISIWYSPLSIKHLHDLEPVVMQPNRYRTVHLFIDNGQVVKISEEKNLPEALSQLNMPLDLIQCGGSSDPWTQEREQWHSGANFFAIAPGKIIGYRRNINTIEELDRKGFAIIDATDVIENKIDLSTYGRCVITIDGSELARGGGGCRCMTMPIRRR
jgi:arginine deiminase